MRKHYGFSHGLKNPYAKMLNRQITIRIDATAISYFQELAGQVGLPYQSLINLYLMDCAAQRRKLKFA
jgi:predicted DNA binding CopG/RHH family protein